MPDDPAPEVATTETVSEVTKRPAVPTDDLVTTSHTLRIGRRNVGSLSNAYSIRLQRGAIQG
jgi:hypothetical protein